VARRGNPRRSPTKTASFANDRPRKPKVSRGSHGSIHENHDSRGKHRGVERRSKSTRAGSETARWRVATVNRPRTTHATPRYRSARLRRPRAELGESGRRTPDREPCRASKGHTPARPDPETAGPIHFSRGIPTRRGHRSHRRAHIQPSPHPWTPCRSEGPQGAAHRPRRRGAPVGALAADPSRSGALQGRLEASSGPHATGPTRGPRRGRSVSLGPPPFAQPHAPYDLA